MPLNVSAAVVSGWARYSQSCDPNLGIAYSTESGGPTGFHPSILYFTSGGQIAGFGARAKNSNIPQNLVPKLWMPVAGQSDLYEIALMFRDPSMLCSGRTDNHVLGTYISINNWFPIPEDRDTATAKGWTQGDCIGEMGIHYSYDLAFGNGTMSWNASNLLPIVPMYGVQDKQIKAILIAVTSWQDTYPFGQFEGPFNNFLFCYNWCPNTGCTFAGADVWSTFHWLFTNYKQVNCLGARCAI